MMKKVFTPCYVSFLLGFGAATMLAYIPSWHGFFVALPFAIIAAVVDRKNSKAKDG